MKKTGFPTMIPSPEDSHAPLLSSRSYEVICHEPHDVASSPLTTIVLIPDSSISLSRTAVSTANEGKKNERGQSTESTLMTTISHRLRRRKLLHDRLSTISDIMCFLGILGAILMVIANEITFMNAHDRQTYINWSIRFIITVTTIILVCLVFYYHYLDLSIYAVNNSLDHWRIGLSASKIVLILSEASICAIHPIPRLSPFFSNPTAADSVSPSYIAIDVALGLPMFGRVYLICRSMVFHSHLFRNASSQSLGSLNHVSLDFLFLVKIYLTQWPARCLLVFCAFLLLIGSWSLRACSYKSAADHFTMLDSMWLFIVTFTTVGYGDLTPATYCGRSVAAIVALVGVLSTALLISVLTQKLELSRAEKYVHNFVLKIELAKDQKIQAANVMKFAIKLWYLKRKHLSASLEYIKTQRMLFRSIHFNKRLKRNQQKLIDSCIGLPELLTIQRETNVRTEDTVQLLATMNSKIEKIEGELTLTSQTMTNIHSTLGLLLDKMSDTVMMSSHRYTAGSSPVLATDR